MLRLTVCALGNNFAIYSVYVPGVHNNIADSLSRPQMDRFRELAQGAACMGTLCFSSSRALDSAVETLWTIPLPVGLKLSTKLV
jgi:hypothetical protein